MPATTTDSGVPLITVDDTRAAARAIKQSKQIARIGGYTAATLDELETVVAKLYKRGLLDAEAAELYEDGDDSDGDDSDADESDAE